ncbi:hypothetical protein CXF68_04845 [Tenacibaculum sp. Bg11-29]|uniref:hypothetical protein n=1 Tax=Tenacibaculum sp. Bg11-29 TaxID=2058306 RepID=UPI000C340C6F|nr:hypothetical protein [Tenacibaculum sp. Bg11-29]PKH50075.1 hypothetical protein CXF68_04845 [Tenacibaculum sp. Bg11-29]
MELTKEQIQRVDKYLDVKGVKFIDFRIEIFDHIISQIEQQLVIGNADFKTAFDQVTSEWNKQLDETSSWIFGFVYPAPKVVINRAKKIFIPYFIISFLIIFLSILFKKIIINDIMGYFTFFLTIIFLLISIFYTLKIWKSKEKTVYNFIIKTQILNFSIVPIIIIDFSINDFFNVSILLYMGVFTYYSRRFYKKHQQEKKKYSLLMN